MRRLIPDLSWFAMVATMIISASGAMTLSEIGTSFADLLTAIPVLIGLVFLLPSGVQRWSTVFIAGAFIGSAVGLKLTNATFAVGAVAMVLCGERPLRFALCFGLGGAVGVGLCGGAWSFYLWQEFQNPFFPFYNKIFHSPAGPSWNAPRAVPYRLPEGFVDALSYPFRWVFNGKTTAEAAFRDARFAVIMVLAGVNLCVAAFQRRWLLSRRETSTFHFFRNFVLHIDVYVLDAALPHRTGDARRTNDCPAAAAKQFGAWAKHCRRSDSGCAGTLGETKRLGASPVG